MKHKILAAVLAMVMLLSVTFVFAEGVDKELINVDGKGTLVRKMEAGGSTVYSVRDLASAVDANVEWNQQNQTTTVTRGSSAVLLKAGSGIVTVNGKSTETAIAPIASQGILFADINALLEALGCQVEKNENGISVFAAKLIEGATSPRWLAGDRILVSTVSDAGVAYYVVNNTSKTFTKLISEYANAVEVAVSHSGQYVAYVNDQGAVYRVNTFNDNTTQISKDTATKSDLQWGGNDDKLYYVAGEKSNIIAQMSISDGKITTLNDDKVEYKSDLSVSKDGSKLLYAVTKTAVFKDAEGTMSVDTTGTEPQLFYMDLSKSGAKPVQLTTGKDYKSSINLLNDGKVIYVSAEDTEYSGLDLKIISQQGDALKMVRELDIIHVQVLKDGRVFALGTSNGGSKTIYEINTDTAEKMPVAIVDNSAVDFKMSIDGTQIVVAASKDEGEGIYLLERKMTQLTK